MSAYEMEGFMKDKSGYVYILTNLNNTVLYIGVTSCLERRLCEHKNSMIPGFTKKYNLHKLVYFEKHESIVDAISREKYLKGKTRFKKESLIEKLNPRWLDLDPSLCSG